jgi:hypothetical protein
MSSEDKAKAKAQLRKLNITHEVLQQAFWNKYVELAHKIARLRRPIEGWEGWENSPTLTYPEAGIAALEAEQRAMLRLIAEGSASCGRDDSDDGDGQH